MEKFDWQPCSNIGTTEKLSKRTCHTVVSPKNQFAASRSKQTTNFFKRVQRTRSLNLGDVSILLEGHQSNFFSKFLFKNLPPDSRFTFEESFHFSTKLRYFLFIFSTIPLDFTVNCGVKLWPHMAKFVKYKGPS